MTQPDLFSSEPKRAKKAINVPSTSVEAYEKQANPTDRMAAVTAWLMEMSQYHHDPTSKELARWRWVDKGHCGPVDTDCVLYVRRGLSDALAKGLVEHAGKRRCTVAGTLALTWRVKSR